MPRLDSPTRWRLIGLAGSCLLAAGAVGSGVFPRPDPLRDAVVLETLRQGTPRVLCVAVAVLGMAVLVTAWLALGRRLEHTDTRSLLITAAVWSLPLILAPPILSRDVYGYAVVGQMLQEGLDPYAVGAAELDSPWVPSTSTSWLTVPFAYGPLLLLLARLVVAESGDSLALAVFGMRLVAVIGTVLLAWALPRVARACGVDERRALWLGLLNPLVLAHFIGGAHADAMKVGLMVAGLALASTRRPALGAVLLALAIGVKATAVVALPFIALLWAAQLTGRSRPLMRAIAATSAVAAGSFAVLTAASGVGYGWIGTLDTVGLSRQWTSLPTGLGLVASGAADLVGFSVETSAVLGVARAVALVVTAALLVRLWVRAARLREAGDARTRLIVLHAGWALLAVVALGPAVHPWYAAWPLAVLAAAGVAGRSRVAVVAVSAAMCFLVLPDGFNLARVTEPVGLALDVVVAAGLVALGVRHARRFRRARRARRRPTPEQVTA